MALIRNNSARGPRDEILRARLGLGPGPVLGFLGGLRPWHGVEILPELLARLSSRHPDAQLLFAGDGQLRGELERRLGELGLRERAFFTGNLPHEQVPAVVRLFDVALAPYPNLDHAFYFSPLKVFEYMACGVAVVASSCGQISEVVRDGGNGCLVPPGEFGCAGRRLRPPARRSCAAGATGPGGIGVDSAGVHVERERGARGGSGRQAG